MPDGSPCDLGDPGWRDPRFPHGAFVASLTSWYSLVTLFFVSFVSAAIPCQDDTMLSLLHQLAHELAPVTPLFGCFVLGCRVLFWLCGFFASVFVVVLGF